MFRDLRHNPCLMTPLTTIITILIGFLMLLSLILQTPTILIGFLLTPLLQRGMWMIEFLYPLSIAKWGHLLLMKLGAKSNNKVMLQIKDKKGNVKDNGATVMLHSRAIEQRTEVVQGRVYIHPLPQLLDNIGYLIVCLPPTTTTTRNKKEEQALDASSTPILGILVDCGDAPSAIAQIKYISDVHYSHIPNNSIHIHSVLCTHKHHDHTAGNKGLLHDPFTSKTLKYIYGAQVENVPYCNQFVKNGDLLKLPSIGNNKMSALVEIECIAVPSHTRGSIVYALRNKSSNINTHTTKSSTTNTNTNTTTTNSEVISHLFTGDAMFSGGGGNPFEADLEFPSDKNLLNKTIQSSFKPNASTKSVERCFAEILLRALDEQDAILTSDGGNQLTNQMLVYPGHEYTHDLLQRQFDRNFNKISGMEWSTHHPSYFFELASQFLIAGHRRALPPSTRLLTVPTCISRELKINPNFRSLRKRGQSLLTAVRVWYSNGRRLGIIKREVEPVAKESFLAVPLSMSTSPSSLMSSQKKTAATDTSWNTNHRDLSKSVFTTVYSSDLESIISELRDGSLSSVNAAIKLSELSSKLEEPTVARRPIPGTIPTEKNMFLGLVALAVLGSPPSSMTYGDSELMNLPSPVKHSDELVISKSRLISVLARLNLILTVDMKSDHDDVVQMIDILWDEALAVEKGNSKENRLHMTEAGEWKNSTDCVHLASLKHVLYEIPSKYITCAPCKNGKNQPPAKQGLKRSSGEIVRHDVSVCKMCCSVVGCPVHINHNESDDINTVRLASVTGGGKGGTEDIELKMTKINKKSPRKK